MANAQHVNLRSIEIDETKVIQVSVGYTKPGVNWFRGTQERGGYWVYITPGRMSRGAGYVSVTSVVGGGSKVHAAPDAGRFNARTLARVKAETEAAIASQSGKIWEAIESVRVDAEQDPRSSWNS